MSAQRLWLPGVFLPSNALADMLRADGVYQERGRRELGGRYFSKPAARSYAAEVKRYRTHAANMALASRLRGWCTTRAALYFVLVHVGHVGQVSRGRAPSARFDADAWYMAAKPIVDGLCDARVLASDRFQLDETGGTVLRVGGLRRLPDGQGFRSDEPGMLVLLTTVDDEPS
jgi:hypothetical protein